MKQKESKKGKDFMKKIKRASKIGNAIKQYIRNNIKEYILVILIFIIGLFIGVMFINNCPEEQETVITTYISEFIEKFKNIETIDKGSLVIQSIKNNMILTIILWLAGTTMIGMPIVLGLILFRGFCLGYTISAIAFTIGTGKSILFCLLALFFQNILFIPALLTIGVSSIKLYKAIMNDRRKENIKIEIIRHTIISFFMLGVMLISSLVENEISVNLLKFGIQYIHI